MGALPKIGYQDRKNVGKEERELSEMRRAP